MKKNPNKLKIMFRDIHKSWGNFKRWQKLLIGVGLGLVIATAISIPFSEGVRQCLFSTDIDQCVFWNKSAWEWLELLGVPLSLLGLGTYLQWWQQQKAKEDTAIRQRKEDAEAREEALQVYIDRISKLLLEANIFHLAFIANDPQGEEMLTEADRVTLYTSIDVIKARTLSILRQFSNDPARQNAVFRFLLDVELLKRTKLPLREFDFSQIDLSNTISLTGINLSFTNLKGKTIRDSWLCDTDFIWADLSDAKLIYCKLNRANFQGAVLRKSYFFGTEMNQTNLEGAILSQAVIKCCGFTNACLRNAFLNGADLTGSYFTKADLTMANLSQSDLTDADFRGSILRGANLREANLLYAKLDDADLTDADLSNAILPEDFS
ncbi:pentapeptide repeat-containing protein [Halomicronema sp. CCY15110]|uniref:pentapeptide repeat-containing protein n=1 Tax=Halomicronema sp. CCY15110 TaxID=2767773 RepID=UPI00194E88FF|nr:pentapeptide repeat-containing protein [Halomicronema sp. CCY15110]